MKLFKKLLLVTLLVLGVVVYLNYPRLNILAGYSAKNTASSVFLAGRSLAFTDSTDNNFSPINLTKDKINFEEKSATGSVFGLLSRKAIYRKGLGAVLINDKFDALKPYVSPSRAKPDINTPYPYGNGIEKDSIFKQIDYHKINTAVNALFKPSNKTRAVLIIYKDFIIAEKYSLGFNKNSRLLGWSMTKSLTGTLFGILQYQGEINIQKKGLFNEWGKDLRKNISIHNLLQMNSGLAWDEDYNRISDVTRMLFLSEDMTKVQLHKALVGKPNETWNYSSGTTNLLSRILRNQFSSQQEYLNFWYSALIDKIGMNSMVLEADMSGNYVASSYAWASPRDWAKLGLLYLHEGNWNGNRIFDKDWVQYATTPTPTSEGKYGAQIWLNKGKRYPDAPLNMYSFNGYQGQNVFVLPDQEMVIVRMGLSKNADINTFLKEVVLSVKI
ncbi:MAG: serine hydrolase domain-containing protein [Tenacibaculum sp.]